MKETRWIVLLAALVAALATARLGLWQLDRAAQKTALQDAAAGQGRLPVLGAADLAVDEPGARQQVQRRALLHGQWLADASVYLDNRSQDGRAGFHLVTPLLLDDGRVLPVQRGWLPRDAADRTRIAPYQTPAGRVAVQGRLVASVSRNFQLGGDGSGPIRQNLDPAQLARDLRKPLLPLALVEDATPFNATDGLGRHWPPPASDVHKHHGYAFQWFALSALVIALYVWFQLIRPRRRAV